MPEWEHFCDRCGSPTDCIEYPDGYECIYCGKWFCGNCLDWDASDDENPVCRECAPLYGRPDKLETD
jgi:hypothetical protein